MARLICIGCPQGCTLEVQPSGDGAPRVRGARCRRGKEYAQNELTDPRRTITTTVTVRGGAHPLVAVRSAEPIPKHYVWQALREVKALVLEAPVAARQVVTESAAGSGIAMVTTRSVETATGTKDPASGAEK